jgi:hypothetical protein
MSQFVFMFRGGNPPAAPDASQQHLQKWVSWMKEAGDRGYFKGGNRIGPGGTVVSGASKTETGLPSAGLVGGYWLVEARDLQHAVELSKGCPILGIGGEVEVRPVIEGPK